MNEEQLRRRTLTLKNTMADATNDTEPPIPESHGQNNEEPDKLNEGDSQEEHVGGQKKEDGKQKEKDEKPEVQTDVKNDGEKEGDEIENNDAKADENLGKVEEVGLNDVKEDPSSNDNNNETDDKNNDTKETENRPNSDEETIQEAGDKGTTQETNEGKENESHVTSEPTEVSSKHGTDDNSNDNNLEEMDPEKLRRKISECQLKSDTLQIELDMAHAKNLELEDKVKTMSESRKKRSESMSSTEAREKAKQRDGLAFQADYLARELSEQQNTEAYLRQKLTETLEEKEELERKNKDLQVRLKRFTKDDQAKDERIARMEKELNDINTEVQEMEKLIDQSSLTKIHEMRQNRSSSSPNGESLPQTGQTSIDRHQTASSPTSKTCIIL